MNRRRFVKTTGLGAAGLCAWGLRTANAMERQPNIVFMLSDDQAWSGLSVPMHDAIARSKSDFCETPNLEKLAQQGMRFSAAYAPASVCSPTRCSLQTGKSPAQNRWTKASRILTAEAGRKLIPPMHGKTLTGDEITIGAMMKTAGYATAHYGKWHLDGGGPGWFGYDEHDGNTNNRDAVSFVDPNPVDIFGMSKRALAFMEKSHKAGKPFFILLSYNALHQPQNALKSTIAKYEKRARGRNRRQIYRAAITEDLDTGVGMIIEGIEKLGLGDHTYLIYMSDNGAGGGRRSGILRGGKGSVWEGGIRVPLIVRGPGIAPNSICHSRVVGYDLFPTFCEWGGVKETLPGGIEGGSLVALLERGTGEIKRPREELVFHFPHYQNGTPQSAILLDNWKLMKFYETNDVQLFNLSKDIGEQRDLSKEMPAKAAELHGRLNAYLKAVRAQMPMPNPHFDPDAMIGQRRRR